MNQIQEIYQKKFSDYQCAIHIRRGDYLKYPNHHPICSLNYYAQAIQYFDNSTNFVIFSDDIDWCRHQDLFQEKRFDFWTSQRDDLDLYLMSIFPHQIIANSSFSWWASWLNIYQNKKVIAPSLWFGQNLKHLNTEDIYASYMLKI
ncbi:MAG: alpha-1,2-fucosyltransferase [Cyanobacterium sp. T60_A2020_053]|nr:alpha-1,2-fucosyltransferase [Cyanobacterium sp. T60_A2020_053]